MNVACVVGNLQVFKGWTFALDAFHPIGLVQGLQGQSLAHLLLLARMDLMAFVGIYQVVSANDTAVGDGLGGVELLLTQLRSPVSCLVSIIVRGYLDELERDLS